MSIPKIKKEKENMNMTNYVIITDSGCDLTAAQVKDLDITVIPITFSVNGVNYKSTPDNPEYPAVKFYADLKAGASVSTSALNPYEIEDVFRPFLEEGKDIIYISFSSALSSICQNAKIVAEELSEEFTDRKITVVDSLCASCGQGLLVYLCANKRLEGTEFDELVAYAEGVKGNICHEFTVDDLGQLKRGGRISSMAALVGSMLQIKPMLYVSPEGKLVSYDKARGRNSSIKMLKDKIIAEAADKNETPIFISHGDCEDDVNMLINMIKDELPEKKFIANCIGPVIGSHSGYKTLAVFTVGNNERGAEREKKQ